MATTRPHAPVAPQPSRPGAHPATGPLAAIGSLVLLNSGAIALAVRMLDGSATHAPDSVKVAVAVILFLSVVIGMLLSGMILSVFGPLPARPTRDAGAEGRQNRHPNRQESESAAREHEEARERFLAKLSHELRTPLAPILTWTRLLRSGALDPQESTHALEVIERNVRAQSRLLDALRDVSRLAAGHLALHPAPLEFAGLVHELAEAHRPVIEERGITFQVILDERRAPVIADRERMEQVIRQLLSNAIKFTPAGGRIQVALTRDREQVTLTVSDSGIGMSAEVREGVFQPFRRHADPLARELPGLGVGLSTAHRLVELQGGTLSAESDGPGRGARFRVGLKLHEPQASSPLAMTPPAAADAGQGAAALGRLDGVRVLVVDDEPAVTESLQALLESCGAEVRPALSAAQARRVFEHWRPDLVISDLGMPEEDGHSLLASLRRRTEGGEPIPAVALTARSDVDDHLQSLAAGFQVFLSKPADPRELLAAVRELCIRPGGRATT